MRSDRGGSISSRTITVSADIEETDSPRIDIPDEPHHLDDSVDTEISNFIRGFITGASLIEKRGRDLHFRLPILQARPHTLAVLFSQLEECKERLGVISYGMSSCTMEEVCVCIHKSNNNCL